MIKVIENAKNIFSVDEILVFDMIEQKRESLWFGKWKGVVRPKFDWTIE